MSRQESEARSGQNQSRPGGLNWWVLVGVIILVGGAIAAAVYFLPTFISINNQQAHEERIKSAIASANYCEVDSDCVIAETSLCPFGCYITVNKAEVEDIRDELKEYREAPYRRRCAYSCIAIQGVACEQNRCVTVQATN